MASWGFYLTSFLASITAYYFIVVVQKPRIRTGNEKIRKFLVKYVETCQKTYWPAPFIWNGILQTICALSRRFPSTFKLRYEREIVVLRDGGQVGLDFLPASSSTDGDTLRVLFLPGLTSSSQTSYVKSLVMAITDAGASVFVLNNRGLGGVPLSTPKSYSAATINDLADILAHLKKKFPEDKFLVVGTSFGGITFNRYLIKTGEAAKEFVIGGLVISCPFCLEGASRGIETPFNKYLINYPICADLKRRMKFYGGILSTQSWYSEDKMKKCKTVRDFDREITSQSYGFKSDEDYYAECSSVGKLHLLPVPVFALSATDDPIQYGKYLPYKEAEAENSKLALITTNYGGHLGFLEGLSPFIVNGHHFMEKLTGDFIKAIIKQRQEFINLV